MALLSTLRYALDTIHQEYGMILEAELEWQALRDESPELYDIALLTCCAERTPVEVADILGIPVANVHLGRQSLGLRPWENAQPAGSTPGQRPVGP
jgi:hypothetical protein